MNSANGIVTKTANCTVEEAVSKIKSLLVIRGITLFAVIDHSGEAESVGMKMPDTKLVIFGNPKGGTPLMLASPLGRPRSSAETSGRCKSGWYVLNLVQQSAISSETSWDVQRFDREHRGY